MHQLAVLRELVDCIDCCNAPPSPAVPSVQLFPVHVLCQPGNCFFCQFFKVHFSLHTFVLGFLLQSGHMLLSDSWIFPHISHVLLWLFPSNLPRKSSRMYICLFVIAAPKPNICLASLSFSGYFFLNRVYSIMSFTSLGYSFFMQCM